jgi:heptosyltransferase-2
MSARLVIFAPNWLGDAVMALPAIADVRRAMADAEVTVAARPSVAPLFALVDGIDRTAALSAGDTASLAGCDIALLLPNAFRTALAAWRAGVPERWGYRADGRRPLLTRSVARPRESVHQVEYYQRLVAGLGFATAPAEPCLRITDSVRDAGARALVTAGWNGRAPLVALAPGAAYGGAKRWPAEYFARLADDLARDGVQTVKIGSAADAPSAAGVRATIDLVAKTDLATLAGVLVHTRTLVTNDSGAMHLAAACGVPVTAVFGPTRDRETSPRGEGHAILTSEVWCRPCMLRECPLDHRCMRNIVPATVAAAARRVL